MRSQKARRHREASSSGRVIVDPELTEVRGWEETEGVGLLSSEDYLDICVKLMKPISNITHLKYCCSKIYNPGADFLVLKISGLCNGNADGAS